MGDVLAQAVLSGGRMYLKDKENLRDRHLIHTGSISEHAGSKLQGKKLAAGRLSIPILVSTGPRVGLSDGQDSGSGGQRGQDLAPESPGEPVSDPPQAFASEPRTEPSAAYRPVADPLDSSQQGREGDATARPEAKKQICFDYTKGVCKRGSSCKYSHDMEEIVRVNSQERGVCFDFLRNTCQRGLLCRFSHDLSNIISQGQNAKQGKKNAPVCYDWVKGTCKRDDCRYSHDIFSIISGKSRGSKTAAPEICYDYTRGKCTRGGSCRYSHDIHRLTAGAFEDVEATLQPSFESQVAVATVAAQQAQLAAYTAAVMEANRRQSAPGSLQMFPQPGSLHAPLGPFPLPGAASSMSMQPPGSAFSCSQPGQLPQSRQLLQSQHLHDAQPWMMHARAHQAWLHGQQQLPGLHSAGYSAAQARPQLPVLEHLGPEQQRALRAAMEAAQHQLAGERSNGPSAPPYEPAVLQEQRRHTYDGGSRPTQLQQGRLLEELRGCSLHQAAQHKFGGFAPTFPQPNNLKAATPPTDRLSEAGIPAVRRQATTLLGGPHLLPPTLPQAPAVAPQSEECARCPSSGKSSAAFLSAAAPHSAAMQGAPATLTTQGAPPPLTMQGVTPALTTAGSVCKAGAAGSANNMVPASLLGAPAVAVPPFAASSAACQPANKVPLPAAEEQPFCSEQLAFCQEIWRQ